MVLRLESIRHGAVETGKYIAHLGKESIKVSALTFIFIKSVQGIAILQKEMTDHDIREGYLGCVRAPVVEELIFRGLLLNIFKVSQKTWSRIRHHQITPELLQSQKIFRVRVTAVLFGLAHITNGVSKQIIFAGFAGLTYGYTAEKTNSCATSMILHFANNFIVYATYFNVVNPGIGITAYYTLRIFDIYVARRGDGDIKVGALAMCQDIKSGVMKTVTISVRIFITVISIPIRLVNSTQDLILPRHLLAFN